jgi:diguanylate cyclase (GGDEF)-like protein/PAS domain S-box-containing protein
MGPALNRTLARALATLVVGLAALLLTQLGAWRLGHAPWGALALPAGLALAARARWGQAGLWAAVVGTGVALLDSGLRPSQATVGALSLGAAALLAHGLMRRLDFDPRLDRACDVAVLLLAGALGSAVPALWALAPGFPGTASPSALAALSAGWVLLFVGSMATATAVISVDERIRRAAQRGHPWVRGWAAPALSAWAAGLLWCLLWLPANARPTWALAALFLPLWVVAALGVTGRLAIGAVFVLLLALLVAGPTAQGLAASGAVGDPRPVVAAWLGSALVLLLIGHAAHAEGLRRRQREDRTRTGAHLGVGLFENLPDGVLITDAELRVLDINPACARLLGVSREDVLGSVPSLLSPSPDDPALQPQRRALCNSLREQGRWQGELLERRRDGSACALQVTAFSVFGPAGELRQRVLVLSDISEQHAQRAQLQRQAHLDELTRLPNRAHLSALMAEAMRDADRDGDLLVVCCLDLDRFKSVNDRFGHQAGDRLLADLAARLSSTLRSREHATDRAARLGGDEFVLLLRAGTLGEARLAVERVLRVLAQPTVIDPAVEPLLVTASMGLTVYPIDRSDADTLLRHADHALYGVKQKGRNGYAFFDPEQRRLSEERERDIGRVQLALDQQELVLHYQPKVDMRSGRVCGVEALLRWTHPANGLVPPSQFLPLIEHTGLSSRIGDWVIAQALEHLGAWRRKGLELSVSVNVSARHLQEPDFSQRLAELLARHAEPLAAWLEIEVTESAAHADIDATSALLARCRALGVRIALDDFGTGYSTLTYLKRLPVDVLKIDRSFVDQMLDDVQDRAIVEGVISLAGTFGCTVVAEGVEHAAQAHALLAMGCALGQGNGIAAPMPAAEVDGWVRHYQGMGLDAPTPGMPPMAGGVGRLAP